MESDNILIFILEWAWVTLFVAVGESFRRLFGVEKKLALLEKDLEHSKEQRVEMLSEMKSHGEALHTHNDGVLIALNEIKNKLPD